MITLLLLTTILALGSTLIIASSPLFLGLWIITLALIIAISANMILTSWLGIIIFLIYVGGLLVIFAYFVALTPNLLVEGKTMVIMLVRSAPLIFALINNFITTDNKILSTLTQHPISFLISENLHRISLIALTLFFALVAVVKICSTFSAPLRPFN